MCHYDGCAQLAGISIKDIVYSYKSILQSLVEGADMLKCSECWGGFRMLGALALRLEQQKASLAVNADEIFSSASLLQGSMADLTIGLGGQCAKWHSSVGVHCKHLTGKMRCLHLPELDKRRCLSVRTLLLFSSCGMLFKAMQRSICWKLCQLTNPWPTPTLKWQGQP